MVKLRFLSVILLTLMLGLFAWSAPLVPKRALPSDQVLSLSRLKKIRLQVGALPVELVNAGLTVEDIKTKWQQRLVDAGFEVTKETDAPTIELRTITDPRLPDAIAINPYLLLHQPVNITRIDRELMLPTYAHVLVGLEPKNNLLKPTQEVLDEMMKAFIDQCRVADKATE